MMESEGPNFSRNLPAVEARCYDSQMGSRVNARLSHDGREGALTRIFVWNLLAIKPLTNNIHKAKGRIDARLLARNLPVINAPSFNYRHDICEVGPLVSSPFLSHGLFRGGD